MSEPSLNRLQEWKNLAWEGAAKVGQDYHAAIYKDFFVHHAKNRREVDFIIENARGKVFDAGCGTGRFTIPIYDAGFEVVGMDISESMLAVAREFAGQRPIPFYQGSAFEVPFEDDTFDTVSSITVIEHFPLWADALREYARVLKPGGRLIFGMRSRPMVDLANSDGVRFGAPAHPNNPAFFTADVTPDEVMEVLAPLGFTQVTMTPFDAFNTNYVLQRYLGPRYDATMQLLDRAFREPGVHDFWQFIERTVYPHLPACVSLNFMVVAEHAPNKPFNVVQPPEYAPEIQRMDADTLRARLGDGFEAFREGLNRHLQHDGVVKFVATFNNHVAPYLPIPFDFLSVLDEAASARVLDQIAWQWAQDWHRHELFQTPDLCYETIPTAPLMEYDTLQHLVKQLKPLVADAARKE